MGYKPIVPAWGWVQGENDARIQSPDTPYKTVLKNLATTFSTDVKTALGTTADIPCITYQTCSLGCYHSYEEDISLFESWMLSKSPTAQMELAAEDSMFLAGSPVYYSLVGSKTHVHLQNEGSYLLGAYIGQAMKDFYIDKFSNRGVTVSSIELNTSSNTIKVSFNSGCYPLVIDETWINKANEHLGFTCINSDNEDIITKVDLQYDYALITCSKSPIGCKLRLGQIGWTGYSGREYGWRTNIRDSYDAVATLPNNKRVNLYNFAFMFEKTITE